MDLWHIISPKNITQRSFAEIQHYYNIKGKQFPLTQEGQIILDAFHDENLWWIWLRDAMQWPDKKIEWLITVTSEVVDQPNVSFDVLAPLIFAVKGLAVQDVAVEIQVEETFNMRRRATNYRGLIRKHRLETVYFRFEHANHTLIEAVDLPNSAVVRLYRWLMSVSLPQGIALYTFKTTM
jgi:hypothetical protein